MKLNLLPKQNDVLHSPAEEILFGGAAGPGKSHLLRVLAIIYCSQIPGIQVYLFRRLSPDLEANHMDGPTGFRALLQPFQDSGHVVSMGGKPITIDWANGAKIHLAHCAHEKDRYKYQGPEFHVLLIDELTHFTDKIYRYLRGRLRITDSENVDSDAPSLEIPEGFPFVVPRIVCGSNPGNVGHNWVKSTFIDGHPELEIHRTSKEEGGLLRQFVPAKLADNPFIDQDKYLGQLHGLGDAALVKAMAEGDWNVVSGGIISDIWHMLTKDKLIIEPFAIPHSWEVFRAFDWGSSKPFSVGWWARSNGEDVTLRDGSTKSYPVGTMFRVHEWYGCARDDQGKRRQNEGLKMLAADIAKGIKEREAFFSFKVQPGPADSSIYNSENGMCIADDMADEGVDWTKADKSPGSRVNGAELIRTMLSASLANPMEDPGLFVFNHCRDFIDLMPVMQRDDIKTDDVDTDQEDHCFSGDTQLRVYNGLCRIDSLKSDDLVQIESGQYMPFQRLKMYKANAETVQVTFSDGHQVTCTPDHKFKTLSGWIPASELLLSQQQFRNGEGLDTTSAGSITSAMPYDYTGRSLLTRLAQSLRAIMSTTMTTTAPTTSPRTLSSWMGASTRATTQDGKRQNTGRNGLRQCVQERRLGMALKRALSGTLNSMRSIAEQLSRQPMLIPIASNAAQPFTAPNFKCSAPRSVSRSTAENPASITSSGFVCCAAQSSPRLSIDQPKHALDFAPLNIESVTPNGRTDTWCITVPGHGHFALANGVIVKNCWDETRYAVTMPIHRGTTGKIAAY